MEWVIVAAVLLLALGLGGGAEFLLLRNPGEEKVPPSGSGELPAELDHSRDFEITTNLGRRITPRRPPHFHTAEKRNRPRADSAAGGSTHGG